MVSLIIVLLDFFLMFYFITFGLGGLLLFLAVLLVTIYYLGKIFYLWQSNLICLTDQRVIDVQQAKIAKPIIKFVSLSKIKNISIDFRSLKQKVLRYGQLKLVIEGLPKTYIIFNQSKPDRLLKAINEQIYRMNHDGADPDPFIDDDTLSESEPAVTEPEVESVDTSILQEPLDHKSESSAVVTDVNFTHKPLDQVETILDQIHDLSPDDQRFILETLKAQSSDSERKT